MARARNHGFDNVRRRKERDPNQQWVELQYARTKHWRTLIIINIILMVLFIGYFANGVDTGTTPAPPVAQDVVGKTSAYNAVEQWMTDGNPLGPDPRILSWDGAKTVTVTTRDTNTGNDVTRAWHRHRMTIATGDGRFWEVEVLTDSGGGVRSVPTAEPKAVSGQTDTVSDAGWENTLGDWTVPDSAKTSINQWATAFIGNDASRLKLTTGDPNPTRQYQPLRLADAAKVDVTTGQAAYQNAGKVDRDSKKSDRAMVRVTLTVNWKDEKRTPGTYSYDLLVTTPDETAHVAAWGGVGTGGQLTPYMNAWHGAPPSATGVKTGKNASQPDGGSSDGGPSGNGSSDSGSDDSSDGDSGDSGGNTGTDADDGGE